jgi:raffinose/stachyose/melibiose transport system substrate-binding protein
MSFTEDLSFSAEASSKRMNRRQFLTVAGGTTLGAAALLAGCGGTSGGSSLNSNGSAAIEFLSVQQANQGWPLVLSTLTTQYAKDHPGTTFKVNYVGQPTQLIQQIQLLAGQGALPILYNTPSNDLMAQLSKNGELLDVGATFQQLGVYNELVPAAVTIANKIYGSPLTVLPFELNIEGFWYNKKMFAQNGIQPPQTFDQLTQIAASFQQKGIQPFTASGTQGWPITRLISNYLYRKIGPDAMDNVKSGQAKLTDPNYVEAAQVVANLGKLGYFGKGVATLDYQPAEDLFLQGKAAMYYMGSWAVRDFTNPSMTKIGASNIGYFPFPNVTGGAGSIDQIAMNDGQTTSVNKKKYNTTIGQWLAYIAKNYGDMALQKEGAVTGFVVHNKPANVDPLTTAILDQVAKVKQPVLWFEAQFSQKATNISQQDAPLLVTGAMAPKDFMTAVQGAL